MKTAEYPPTPELDKMKGVKERSQSIGAFLDWLQSEREIVLAEYEYRGETLYPINLSIEKLLAEYFEIDLEKVEQERRAILAHIRK